VFRLLNSSLGDQGGWLLALAIVGGVSLLAAAIAARRRRDLGALTVIGGWFVAAAAVFSLSKGIIHTYYLSALAPATSALVGAGVLALVRDAKRGGRWLLLPLVAIVGTALLEFMLLGRSGYLSWLQTLLVAAAALAAVALAIPRVRVAGIAVAVAVLFAAPAAWSATTWKFPVSGVFPGAGQSFDSSLSTQTAGRGFGFRGGGGGGFGGPPSGGAPPTGFGGGQRPTGGQGFGRTGGFGSASSGNVTAALAYVKAHGATKRFALVVSSEQEAASYVIAGDNVAAMGGFTGRETVLTPSFLSSLIRSGEARYFLLGDANGFGQQASNAAVNTVSSICTKVSGFTSGTLYDCAGKADAIAASG
jgi:hypothetical protein